MKIAKIRSIGVLTAIVVTSIVLPLAFSSLQNAITPHFDPVAFGLPATAQEVVSKRTEKAVTFEISPGKFASVSAGERLESLSCDRATLSTLCKVVTHVRGFVPSAFAVSQGPNSPGTLSNDASVGTVAWTSPSNATSSNDLYASIGLANILENPEISNYLKALNYSFSIPVSSTINGVAVDVERISNNWIVDAGVYLVKGGTIQGSNKGDLFNDWSTDIPNDEVKTYGSNSDLWGLSLTATDINSSTFGVVLSCKNNTSGDYSSGYIDHIRITVYYTEPAGAAAPFFSWWSLPLMLLGCGWVLWKEGYLGGEPLQERT